MRTAGIIAECNPFHSGHAYLLEEARRRTGADYIVVAMSGDFVQRGAPAILDKRARARRILEAGADLVLELPLYIACGSAGYFAEGGVRLLDSLGVVTDLCFGSESGDADALSDLASQLASLEQDASYRQHLQSLLRQGRSYPAAAAQAAQAYGLQLPECAPNDLLALSYCRTLCETGSSVRPLAIPRISTEGATALRKQMLADPAQAGSLLWEEDLSEALLHALSFSPCPLSDYLDVSEDLAARIEALLPSYTGFTQFCGLLKNRSLTYTRVSRALLHILLGLRTQDVQRFREHGLIGYLRPLGFRRSAAPLLKAIRSGCGLPLLTKPASGAAMLAEPFDRMLQQDLRASEFASHLRQMKRMKGMAAGEASGISPEERPVCELSQPLILL